MHAIAITSSSNGKIFKASQAKSDQYREGSWIKRDILTIIDVPISPIDIKRRRIDARYQRTKFEKKQKTDENTTLIESISVPGLLTYLTMAAASMKNAHQNKMSNINTVTGFFWATASHPARSSNGGGEQIAGRSCQSASFARCRHHKGVAHAAAHDGPHQCHSE